MQQGLAAGSIYGVYWPAKPAFRRVQSLLERSNFGARLTVQIRREAKIFEVLSEISLRPVLVSREELRHPCVDRQF